MDESGLTVPETGTLRISVKAGEQVKCGFTPESVLLELQGEDLVVTSSSHQGGALVLVGFVPAVEDGEVILAFPDFAISGKELCTVLSPDFDFVTSSGTEACAGMDAAPAEDSVFFSALLDSESENLSDLLHGVGDPGGATTFDPDHAAGSASQRFLEDSFIISVPWISQDTVDDVTAQHLRADLFL